MTSGCRRVPSALSLLLSRPLLMQACRGEATAATAVPASSSKPRTSISAAMRVYLERKRAHDAFMAKELREFEVGKEHLANMMGLRGQELSEEQVDSSVEYLFPSSLSTCPPGQA